MPRTTDRCARDTSSSGSMMTRLALLALAGVAAAALWWRRNPSACPYNQRFWVEAPHPLITRPRLRDDARAAAGRADARGRARGPATTRCRSRGGWRRAGRSRSSTSSARCSTTRCGRAAEQRVDGIVATLGRRADDAVRGREHGRRLPRHRARRDPRPGGRAARAAPGRAAGRAGRRGRAVRRSALGLAGARCGERAEARRVAVRAASRHARSDTLRGLRGTDCTRLRLRGRCRAAPSCSGPARGASPGGARRRSGPRVMLGIGEQHAADVRRPAVRLARDADRADRRAVERAWTASTSAERVAPWLDAARERRRRPRRRLRPDVGRARRPQPADDQPLPLGVPALPRAASRGHARSSRGTSRTTPSSRRGSARSAAGRLYNAMRAECPKCRIVAGDMLDTPGMTRYTERYKQRAARAAAHLGPAQLRRRLRPQVDGDAAVPADHERAAVADGDRRRRAAPEGRVGVSMRRRLRDAAGATRYVLRLAESFAPHQARLPLPVARRRRRGVGLGAHRARRRLRPAFNVAAQFLQRDISQGPAPARPARADDRRRTAPSSVGGVAGLSAGDGARGARAGARSCSTAVARATGRPPTSAELLGHDGTAARRALRRGPRAQVGAYDGRRAARRGRPIDARCRRATEFVVTLDGGEDVRTRVSSSWRRGMAYARARHPRLRGAVGAARCFHSPSSATGGSGRPRPRRSSCAARGSVATMQQQLPSRRGATT